jgi:nickel-type superoxide dismutase maturation protease
MLPTLRPGDRLLVDPRAYRGRPPSPGDIVVLHDPEVASRLLVKRVASVAPNGVMVAGDEPARSRDSRAFGPVPLSALLGRAYRCYHPAERRRTL